jgi:hypothetical protein
MASKNKTTETVAKPTKVLSPKRQTELDHVQGKHAAHKQDAEGIMYQRSLHPDCGFCQRRVKRVTRRSAK